mgnify:CR=1 FL=1
MKKILLIHNKYRNIGGEDIAVQNEIKFLKKYYTVKVLYFDNVINRSSYIKQIISFFLNSNKESIRLTKVAIEDFQPDLVYVHNTWFKASVGIFKLLKKNNLQTFIKLHNFRYDCTRSYFIKNHLSQKETCPACGLRYRKFKIFNKYFENSYLKSLFAIIYGRAYFKVLTDNYFNLFVLTNFHRDYLFSLGIKKDKIYVLPNSIKITDKTLATSGERFILYAGRISSEKGVEEIIKSYLKIEDTGLKLKIVGQGPTLEKLINKYKNPNIEFLGELQNSKVIKIMEKAMIVITATKLFEGQPTLLCEASSLGIPSIFPETGGIKEFFPDQYQLSFKQFDYIDLEEKLNLTSNVEMLKTIGKENKKYLLNYLDENRLLEIFQKGIDG